MNEANTEPNAWPPESFTNAQEPDPISIQEMESSLRSSILTDAQERHLQKLGKWCEKHGKVFRDTPTFPYLAEGGEHGSDGEPAGSAATAGHRPPKVIRGANGHEQEAQDNGVAVSVDYLTMTGPRGARHKAASIVEAFFGELKPGNGLLFLNSGLRIGSNAGVFFDEGVENPKDHCAVTIPGSLLTELRSNSLVQQLVEELMRLGFKATRIDVAADHYEAPKLIENALESCEKGFLTGARTYSLREETSSRKLAGRTLYIGKRGKNGSGRFLRIYDKGLETKTREKGDWIRWEVEYTGDCARQVAEDFVAAGELQRVLLDHAMGVVDFKLSPGKKLARRQRCKWFAELLKSLQPKRVTESRVASTVETKVRWFRTCVAPFLRTCQRCTGDNLDRVMKEITGDIPTKPQYLADPLLRSVCDTLGVPPYQLHEAYAQAAGGYRDAG